MSIIASDLTASRQRSADRTGLSRRNFLRATSIAGVTVWIAPLASRSYAALFEQQILQPAQWNAATGATARRIDGLAKVTGEKVFARDIRARDMPHWPQQQSHALFLRTTHADRVYEGFDLRVLGEDLKPDRVVTADDLARDRIALPDFYGDDMLLPTGKTPAYLGQAVALLIFHDFARHRFARERLRNSDALRYGAVTGTPEREPWGVFRYVRQGGQTPYAEDVYSSLRDAPIFPTEKKTVTWPKITLEDSADTRGMKIAQQIAQEFKSPPEDWLVLQRRYSTQSVDTAALEPDNANCWYDTQNQALHLVLASQSPQEVAEAAAKMVAASAFPLKQLFVHPCYTVGYGSKDHASVPYYGLLAALYGDGRPVRYAVDRFEHFQTSLKRHAFELDYTIAVNRKTGVFQSFKAKLTGNGGGRANFSPSVAMVAATAAQSIYYFPKNDMIAIAAASRAVDAGSARGYGTLQSMAATEMMVDEIAEALGMDAIELRLVNVLKSGMKNTQGAIPAGAVRADEALRRAAAHPLWKNRAARKAEFEARDPNLRYGVGFACVQKDFGTGGDGIFARVELTPDGRVVLHNIGVEMGTGTATSQAVLCAKWFGRAADEVHTGVTDWPELPMVGQVDTYTMKQDDQDRLAQDPLWTPVHASPSSASCSSYFFGHGTSETARVVFEHGIWPAAVALWSAGFGGGQAAPYVLRREDARWVDGRLTASGMEPLALDVLAKKAYEKGWVTAAVSHSFNRWQWATAEFHVGGTTERRPLDGLAVRYGSGQQGDNANARAGTISGEAARQAAQPNADDKAGASPVQKDTNPVALATTGQADGARGSGAFSIIERRNVAYPDTRRNNAGVTYYSANAALVELSVNLTSGKVELLSHHSILECGKPIVTELVSGQLQGGIAMGIGHALHEWLPLYEDGPGNGSWNFNRYHLPRARDVAVWRQTAELLPPLSDTDPAKGIAEVVMIPIVGAVLNGIAHATGYRFTELPVTPKKILEVVAL